MVGLVGQTETELLRGSLRRDARPFPCGVDTSPAGLSGYRQKCEERMLIGRREFPRPRIGDSTKDSRELVAAKAMVRAALAGPRHPMVHFSLQAREPPPGLPYHWE